MPVAQTRKITLSLPAELIAFADSKALESKTNRSHLIGEMLRELKERERDALAREGYRFFAQGNAEFAEASASAVAEAFVDDRSSW